MTKKKVIPSTIKKLIHGDTFARVLDRAENIDDIYEEALSHWDFSIDERQPGPALYDENSGIMQKTDLDMASILGTLLKRNAILVFPDYTGTNTAKSGSSKGQKRQGALKSLVSNQEFFSFSVGIEDMSVLSTQNGGKLGAPRTLHVIGKDGEWHPTHSGIDFVPTAEEAAFIEDFKIATKGSVVFENFVNPRRWGSFYGQHYLISKAILQRLQEEAQYHAEIAKRCVSTSTSTGGLKAEHESGSGASGANLRQERLECPVFEAEVQVPYHGAFTPIVDPEVAKARVSAIRYRMAPALQFPLRATEYAFYRHLGEGVAKGVAGAEVDNAAGFPNWMKNVRWNTERSGRIATRRLVYSQLLPGQQGVSLAYRIRAKKADVPRA